MRLPHVRPFKKYPLYFFTACTAGRRPCLANQSAFDILENIWQRARDFDGWHVGRFALMPDHIHFFATPTSTAKPREIWTKLWKSVSSRRLAKELSLFPPIWQNDTFDPILRGKESYDEKWNYVRQNPVRGGLCQKSEDWPWQGEINSLKFE